MAKLIGTAPNQVPTNADLGSMAYVDKDHFDANITELTLGAYEKIIGREDVTSIFVYDTSKDSDGGAWRKRTSHLSWYNEGPSDIRGSRKEFPAIAVIVANDNYLTIYDGDDPDFPMWMKFNTSSDSSVRMLRPGIADVEMLNGTMAIGHSGSSNNNRLGTVNFLHDTAWVYYGASVQIWNYGIADRNRNTGDNGYHGLPSAYADIVNRYVSGVAMTVLPNAPVDPVSKLPIPTIVAATQGGLSFLLDTYPQGPDKVIYDKTSTGPDGSKVARVRFGRNNELIVETVTNYDARYDEVAVLDVQDFPYAGDAGSYNWGWVRKYDYTWSTDIACSLGYANSQYDYQGHAVPTEHNKFAADAPHGFTMVSDIVKSGRNENLVHYVTPKWVSGWQLGYSRLCTMADTSTDDVTGDITPALSEFYGVRGGSVSVSGDTVTVTSGNTLPWNGTTVPVTGLVVGEQYIAELTCTGGTFGTGGWYMGFTTDSSGAHSNLIWGNADIDSMGSSQAITNGVTMLLKFTAISATDYIIVELNTEATGETLSFNNFSVRKVEVDRSTQRNGVAVHGTITKTPVATGAEIVGYSGFSASNFLRQPYNSSLGFSSNDMTIMGWVRREQTHGARDGHFFDLTNSAGDNRINMYIKTNNTLYWAYDGGYIDSGKFLQNNSWHFIVATVNPREARLYFDGVLIGTNTTGQTQTLPSDAYLTFGKRFAEYNSEAYELLGSMAMWRISQGNITSEQVEQVYQDERALFRDGAQATLYRNSGATGIYHLDYDDVTNTLHVKTNDGRSDFQGLVRVAAYEGRNGRIGARSGLVVDVEE